jgi:hypothetical protein
MATLQSQVRGLPYISIFKNKSVALWQGTYSRQDIENNLFLLWQCNEILTIGIVDTKIHGKRKL